MGRPGREASSRVGLGGRPSFVSTMVYYISRQIGTARWAGLLARHLLSGCIVIRWQPEAPHAVHADTRSQAVGAWRSCASCTNEVYRRQKAKALVRHGIQSRRLGGATAAKGWRVERGAARRKRLASLPEEVYFPQSTSALLRLECRRSESHTTTRAPPHVVRRTASPSRDCCAGRVAAAIEGELTARHPIASFWGALLQPYPYWP